MSLNETRFDAVVPPTPLVGVTTCNKVVEQLHNFVAAEPYVTAVAEGASALPMLIPSRPEGFDVEPLVARLDGLVVTGSRSNVEPHRYGGPNSAPGTLHDPARDAVTLPLIRMAVAQGCPVFAICRGIQEFNVAFGGTLHQEVHTVPGLVDHRPDRSRPLDEQFAPSQRVDFVEGGLLAALAGSNHAIVNSLHGQGIDQVAPGLIVEATAPDGLVEAVRVAGAERFALGVQWHPEWRFHERPLSTALFRLFGEACRDRAMARGRPPRPSPKTMTA
ncbi:MAG: hypothetical protein CMM50_03140 [Rhodospirillaceae bacterium]|nr:hypothetical protein [Rhodospirillaceae bacterium]